MGVIRTALLTVAFALVGLCWMAGCQAEHGPSANNLQAQITELRELYGGLVYQRAVDKGEVKPSPSLTPDELAMINSWYPEPTPSPSPTPERMSYSANGECYADDPSPDEAGVYSFPPTVHQIPCASPTPVSGFPTVSADGCYQFIGEVPVRIPCPFSESPTPTPSPTRGWTHREGDSCGYDSNWEGTETELDGTRWVCRSGVWRRLMPSPSPAGQIVNGFICDTNDEGEHYHVGNKEWLCSGGQWLRVPPTFPQEPTPSPTPTPADEVVKFAKTFPCGEYSNAGKVTTIQGDPYACLEWNDEWVWHQLPPLTKSMIGSTIQQEESK